MVERVARIAGSGRKIWNGKNGGNETNRRARGEWRSPSGSRAPRDDLAKAQDIARRYRCEFVDLHNFQLHHDLFKKIPVDLMFRYNFVPLEETEDGRLAIALADPSQLMMIDEISLLLGKRMRDQGCHAGADHRDPQEDRAVAARAGRSQRRLHAGRGRRGREPATKTASPSTG